MLNPPASSPSPRGGGGGWGERGREAAEWSKVDLHLHTTSSDGVFRPSELVNLALERSLEVIAITDHDSTGGVDEAQAAAIATGLEVIAGVELNTDVIPGEAHILGYYLRHHDTKLRELLAQRRAARLTRGEEMVHKLTALGLEVSWDRVQALAGAHTGGVVGRPHVAQALCERGYVATTQEAFEKYLGRDGPAFVPYEKFSPEQAIQVIRHAAGVPVLAHPTSLPDWEERLPALIEAGLAGLECYYGTYLPETVVALATRAAVHGLIATGGSDFHGPTVSAWTTSLGGTPVPREAAEALKTRRPTDAAPAL